MKLAKKALVVVMAIAMIGCMSAVAFAAGSVSLDYDGAKNISITANGMIGLQSFDFTITADDGIVIKNVKDSSVSDQCKAIGNAYSYEFNKANGQFSGYFKENLWSTDDWNVAADDMGEDPISFDPNSFNMGTIVIDASGATGPAYVYITGSVKGVDATIDAKVLVVAGEPASEHQEPASEHQEPASEHQEPASQHQEPASQHQEPASQHQEPASQHQEPASEHQGEAEASEKDNNSGTATPTEKPSKAPAPTQKNVNTGDVPTGDNMALAAAFGVVALAGAAFIISKKRK